MRYRPGNAQEIGGREEQQDAFAFSDIGDEAFADHGGVLAVVADGMGGLAGGRAASQTAVRTFLDAYCGKAPGDGIDTALDRAIHVANQAVCDLVSTRASDAERGTTLVAGVLHDDGLRWISVGDSRIYLVRSGHAEQVTLDHNYALELDGKVASGELSMALASTDPDRESLVSYLGQSEIEAVDRSVSALPLRRDDLVIVCSDGLYRTLDAEEIGRHATRESDPQALCEMLAARVLAKRLPHQDNCTVLAVSSRTISERRERRRTVATPNRRVGEVDGVSGETRLR